MTLSELFYEAACDMSDENWVDILGYTNDFSCHQIAYAETKGSCCTTEASALYAKLMTYLPSEVESAANKVRWPWRDFRTFMLLMASEAVK